MEIARLDEIQKKKRTVGDEDRCPICLSCPMDTPCLLDQCFHTFCMYCALQWAQVGSRPSCPLCKREFESVLYEVVSSKEYKRMYVVDLKQKNKISPKKPLQNDYIKQYNEQFGTKQSKPSHNDMDSRKIVYSRQLYSEKMYQTEILSPQNYCSKKSFWETKLQPWIKRELKAVLGEDDVDLFVSMILSILQKTDLRSPKAKAELRQILFDDLDIFIHELLNFANSPYDLITYDRKVRYKTEPLSREWKKKKEKKQKTEVVDLSEEVIDLSQEDKTKVSSTLKPPAIEIFDDNEIDWETLANSDDQ